MNEPLPSPQIVSFDWDSLVDPCLPSTTPFQINFQVENYIITRCIVDEGAYVSILSTHAWIGMGSPNLMSVVNQSLAFDRRPSQTLGVLIQTPVTLGGKTILVDFMVIEDPLDFNMLLGHDYVYSMKVVVSTLFRVM